MLLTDKNMGDHGEMVRHAIAHQPGETVAELVERVGKAFGPYIGVNRTKQLPTDDVIEIRVVAET